jgi:hypothetical protein
MALIDTAIRNAKPADTSPIADIGCNVSFRCWCLTPGDPNRKLAGSESRCSTLEMTGGQ